MSEVELNVGDGKKCSNCGGTVAAGRKTCQNCGTSFAALTIVERIQAAEAAVLALGRAEFGDVAGHGFYGNQSASSSGDSPEERAQQRKHASALTPGERKALLTHARDTRKK